MNHEQAAAAWRRARRLYPASKNLRNTYMRGAQAAADGKPVDACPYPPGGQTWRQSYRLAWVRGHQSIQPEEDE